MAIKSATCIIGGVSYTIPELNFIALERAWPFIEASMMADPLLQPMKGPAAGISVIAAGLCEAYGFDKTKFGIPREEVDEDLIFDTVVKFLKKALKASELGNITQCLNKITEEAGLVESDPLPPPVEGGDPVNPSTGTVLPSSPNLSQLDVKAEAGTE